MSPKTTKQGFIKNGMIDKCTHTYPDLFKMKTCKSDIKKEVEDIIFDNFSLLYQTMKQNSHITEEIYDELGLPKDSNYEGEVVKKPNTISQ